MQRGFKARAEADAGRLRREVGLESDDRLDPFALAEYLGLPVFPLHRLLTHGASAEAIAYFKGRGRGEFSAATIADSDGYAVIIYNERHVGVRQCSNVCHELAHVVLFHEPTELVSSDGYRIWDAEREEEANWFGATLLVPRAGALEILDTGMELADAADHFGVSEALFRWRVQQTGIVRQLGFRARARERRLVGGTVRGRLAASLRNGSPG